MIITCGIYNLTNYKLTIEQFEVKENRYSFSGITSRVRFMKDKEDQVCHVHSKFSPYLEVFTLNERDPVEYILYLLKEWFKNKANEIDSNRELRLINDEYELEE